MWILRYEYVAENGAKIKISCCLKQATQYGIGRSTKSPLHIKNDKSISRQHVQLDVDDHDVLTVKNIGKLTKISGKSVKVGQSVKFSSLVKATFEMGASPVVGSVAYEKELWKIPHDLSASDTVKKQLALYGVLATDSLSPKTTIQIIKHHQENYSNCLFALLSNIPILREGFIDEFLRVVSTIQNDFDSKWDEIKERNVQFPQFKTQQSTFKGLNFLVTNRGAFAIFKHIVDAGMGTLWLCDDISKLDSFVRQNVRSEKIIILIHLNDSTSSLLTLGEHGISGIKEAKALRLEAQRLGLKTYDVNDVVNAVLMNNISSLLERIPTQDRPLKNLTNASLREKALQAPDVNSQVVRSPETEQSHYPAKLKRANRQRIMSLNSLSFFGGGSSLSKDANLREKDAGTCDSRPAENEFIAHDVDEQPPLKKPHLESSDPVPNSPTPSDFKDIIPPSKRLHDSDTADNIETSLSGVKRARLPGKKEVSKPQGNQAASTSCDAADSSVNIPNEKEIKNSVSIVQSPMENDSFPVVNNTLRGAKRSVSFVRAIQETKSHEVDRLKEKMANVQGEELTEEAIMRLDNLAIVETKDLLRSKDASNNSLDTSTNSLWAGRKNFKKFVKLRPSRSSKASPGSVSDSIRNKAYLITREYVPMRQYDGRRSASPDESFSNTDQPAEEEVTALSAAEQLDADFGVEVNDEPRFSFTSQRHHNHIQQAAPDSPRPGNDQGLFIVDDDDSQERHGPSTPPKNNVPKPDRQATLQTKPHAKSSRNIAPGDSDDDSDDEPRFQFQSRRNL
ncbi:LANO_0H22276g1_1 [Lachancea nothofagi CBS 11611]|uniref:LANO_0H22276g1_1 n=1 Tax=Lachancea nothofagi CBS 11611 TaxID=1266666 RepID=A0A1G4KNG7_9SACH|nr:LANO_0H22276g1_1 [Lachancea nothofagi CBS 11611]